MPPSLHFTHSFCTSSGHFSHFQIKGLHPDVTHKLKKLLQSNPFTYTTNLYRLIYPIIEPPEDQSSDTVEYLLTHTDDVAKLMKMERKILLDDASRWFPYLDRFKCQNTYVMSSEILEAVAPCISDVRKERFRNVVSNKSYSLCLAVKGLRLTS